jgi:hypothetical protein
LNRKARSRPSRISAVTATRTKVIVIRAASRTWRSVKTRRKLSRPTKVQVVTVSR